MIVRQNDINMLKSPIELSTDVNASNSYSAMNECSVVLVSWILMWMLGQLPLSVLGLVCCFVVRAVILFPNIFALIINFVNICRLVFIVSVRTFCVSVVPGVIHFHPYLDSGVLRFLLLYFCPECRFCVSLTTIVYISRG